jgi:hypothetical protein
MDSESDAPKKRARRYEWDSLRALGSNRLVQLTVILPIIGYVILFSSELREYFVLTVDRDVRLGIDGNIQPVFWRLYFLYFGFCFLALGSLIFSWKCPSEVKSHGAGFVYVEREGPVITDGRLQHIRDYLVRAYFEATYGTRAARRFFDKPNPGESSASQDVAEQYSKWLDVFEAMVRNDLLLEYFVALKMTRKPWRVASRTCYDLGFALLSVPTAQVFYSVAATVYSDIVRTF